MSVKISVIVPVYNVEAYVGKCINSILSQTYKNYELILLNDGSTDNSLGELLKYESNPSVTIIDKKNTGQADTRYQGLLMAKGEYVYFVDSDDFVESDTLEKLIAQAEENNADVVFGRYRLIDERGNKLREQKKYSVRVLDDTEDILKDAICFLNFKASLWIKLIKKSLFVASYNEEVRYLRVNEDMYLSIVLASLCKKVIFIDDIIYNVLQRKGSISRCVKPELITSNETIYKNAKTIITGYDLWENCKKDFYRGYLKTILYCLGLAAIKSNSFTKYKVCYELLGWNTFYHCSDLDNNKQSLSIPQRLLFSLSHYPKLFYLVMNFCSTFLKY